MAGSASSPPVLVPEEAELRRRLEAVRSWEDWRDLERELFLPEAWPETPDEECEAQLERPEVRCGEEVWRPLALPYAIPAATFHLHQWARWEAFARLDPEGERDNLLHPERFGQACYRCQRYCETTSAPVCPLCQGELVRFPLNP